MVLNTPNVVVNGTTVALLTVTFLTFGVVTRRWDLVTVMGEVPLVAVVMGEVLLAKGFLKSHIITLQYQICHITPDAYSVCHPWY